MIEEYKADGKHTERMATVCCLRLIFDKYNSQYGRFTIHS